MYKLLLPIVACAALTACATVPQPLKGDFAKVSLHTAAQSQGTRVRWGGEIIETVPDTDHTCIYALSRPLNSQARPQSQDDSMGRFVACHSGFYDPAVFTKGRDITVVGTLDGTVTRKVGEYDYPYPRVAADTIYLWPRPTVDRRAWRDPFMYNPMWRSPFWNPYWNRPTRVIIVPTETPDNPDSQ